MFASHDLADKSWSDARIGVSKAVYFDVQPKLDHGFKKKLNFITGFANSMLEHLTTINSVHDI